MHDLIVLTADANMEHGLRALLARDAALMIHPITCQFYRHPAHDPGCLRESHVFLRPFQYRCRHALVVFDREGAGRDDSRAALEEEVELRLANTGWDERAAAVVIDPELEAWVWSDSPHVDQVLGWGDGGSRDMRAWLREQGLLGSDAVKPSRPKEALEAVLRRLKCPRSSAIYRNLAQRVSLERCVDESFAKLRGLLAAWFPANR